jgi:hypothetical protein
MRPTQEDRRLAKIAVEVFRAPKSDLLNDKKVIEWSDKVREYFQRQAILARARVRV